VAQAELAVSNNPGNDMKGISEERLAWLWMLFLIAFTVVGIMGICGGIIGMTIYFLRVQ